MEELKKAAPDKIYTDNRGVYAEFPIFSQTNANIEYIRKDALLEKIDEILSAKPDTNGIAVEIAAQVLTDIKKVINSM